MPYLMIFMIIQQSIFLNLIYGYRADFDEKLQGFV